MVKVDDILADLISGKNRLTDALLKTKVLLFSIEKKELSFWVDYELNGYPKGVQVPDYRIASARVLINANNLAHHYKGLELQLRHFDEKKYKDATESQIHISISQIENLLSEESSKGYFIEAIPVALARHYAPEIDNSYHITKIYKQIATHNLTSIITQVRSRLIDFMLELSSQLDATDGKNMADKAKQIDASSLFNNAIFGPNTIINLGSGNIAKITNNIEMKNLEMLKEHLKEHGVQQPDIEELVIALSEDDKISNSPANTYGPNLGRWFTKMLSKASDNSWAIGVNVASTLLTTSLNQYLGIGS
jgi:hypothetical protein